MTPPSIFISYSHKDEALVEELLEFLQPLKIAGRITLWNDRAIDIGQLWDEEIKKALHAANIILLLLSPSFLASSYINRVEISGALENRREKKAWVIPVMLRPCDLESHIVPGEKYQIKDFLGLPKDMQPVIKWETHEDAWIDVINGLKRVIGSIQSEQI
jgi:TIR domain-containing protein